MLFLLPYLGITAIRLRDGPVNRCEAAFAGLLAGIGVALKPHFLAVPFLVELGACIAKRRLRFAFRPEVAIAATLIGAYATFLALFVGNYVYETIPMIKQIYWGFDNQVDLLFIKVAVEIAIGSLACWIALRHANAGSFFATTLADNGRFFGSLCSTKQRLFVSSVSLPRRSVHQRWLLDWLTVE